MNSKKIKSSPKGRCRLPLHVYLAYLLVCTLLLTGVSFSRYISTANAGDSARVAKGVVTVSYDENTELKLERPTDDGTLTENFQFHVSNSVSEVAIRYDVVVTLDKALGNGVTLTLDGRPGTVKNGGIEYEFPNMGIFAAGVSDSKTHTLSFAGDFMEIPSGTDDTYSIQIAIRSQQID